ncbi:MAG: hypothetical protein ACYC3F_00985 [Gemmatimonadaceae bacterium]
MPSASSFSHLPFAPRACVVEGPAGAPKVFLLDEFHGSPSTITQNLAIAAALFATEGVEMAGVEDYYSKDDFYDGDKSHAVNHRTSVLPGAEHSQSPTVFGARLCSAGSLVVGVDSTGWESEILTDIAACDPLLGAGEHIAQIERSQHFVRALIREREERSLKGNALINCGSAHNGHIVSIAMSGARRPPWWPEVTFIRLRAPAHP